MVFCTDEGQCLLVVIAVVKTVFMYKSMVVADGMMEKHNCHCVSNVFNEILYCLFGLLVNEF